MTVWEGRARVLGAPGTIDVEIEGDDIAITLNGIGLAKQPLTGISRDGGTITGTLGTVGTVVLEPEGAGLTLKWRRGGEALNVPLAVRTDEGHGDGPYPFVDAIVATRNGETVREEYFNGTTADDIHTQQSCTKSITSLVVGTAVDRGELELDKPVWSYVEALRPDSRWVKERYPATVHHLLCMSVGLDWNEEVHYTDPRNDNTRMNASGDWVGYVLDKGLQEGFPAGKRFEYQSGLSILLGYVLQAATGQKVDALARERLFGPLGIDTFTWTKDGDGNPHTGGGLILRPRDMVKLGQMILDGGAGVLSKEWIETSTRHQTTHDESGTRYAYKWFLGTLPVGERSFEVIGASGYGGQSLFVVPELDMVIQSNAHDWFGEGAMGKLAVETIERTLA